MTTVRDRAKIDLYIKHRLSLAVRDFSFRARELLEYHQSNNLNESFPPASQPGDKFLASRSGNLNNGIRVKLPKVAGVSKKRKIHLTVQSYLPGRFHYGRYWLEHGSEARPWVLMRDTIRTEFEDDMMESFVKTMEKYGFKKKVQVSSPGTP